MQNLDSNHLPLRRRPLYPAELRKHLVNCRLLLDALVSLQRGLLYPFNYGGESNIIPDPNLFIIRHLSRFVKKNIAVRKKATPDFVKLKRTNASYDFKLLILKSLENI